MYKLFYTMLCMFSVKNYTSFIIGNNPAKWTQYNITKLIGNNPATWTPYNITKLVGTDPSTWSYYYSNNNTQTI